MIQTLVTGGTGFVGSAIVRFLIKGVESVRVLSRDPLHILPERRAAGTEFLKGDIFEDRALEEAMKGCDALIIAAQFENAPFENPKRGRTYERVDGEGTERQVAIAKKAGIRRIIYISGAGVREGRDEPWFKAKLRAERAVKESGTDWTIFRPSWIYGPTDRSLNRFALMARVSPIIFLIGSGKEKIQPVYIEDVGLAVSRSLNHPQTFGKVFEIGGPEELSMKQIVQTMLRVMRKRRFILPQPKPFMKGVAALMQHLPGRPLTPDGVDFVTMEEKVDNTLLVQTLGLRLRTLEEGLRNYLSLKKESKLTEAVLRRHAA